MCQARCDQKTKKPLNQAVRIHEKKIRDSCLPFFCFRFFKFSHSPPPRSRYFHPHATSLRYVSLDVCRIRVCCQNAPCTVCCFIARFRFLPLRDPAGNSQPQTKWLFCAENSLNDDRHQGGEPTVSGKILHLHSL